MHFGYLSRNLLEFPKSTRSQTSRRDYRYLNHLGPLSQSSKTSAPAPWPRGLEVQLFERRWKSQILNVFEVVFKILRNLVISWAHLTAFFFDLIQLIHLTRPSARAPGFGAAQRHASRYVSSRTHQKSACSHGPTRSPLPVQSSNKNRFLYW